MPAKWGPAQIGSKLKCKGPPPIRCFTLGDCALISIWLLLIAIIYFAGAALDRTFLDWAVFGAAVLCVFDSRKGIAVTILLAAPFLGFGLFLRMHLLSATLLALGCGGVLLLTWRTIQGSKAARENLRIGAGLPMFVLITAFANGEIVQFTPRIYDSLLLKADFGTSAALRSWVSAHSLIARTVGISYEALPLVVVLAIAASSGRDRIRLLWSLCLAAVLAIPCYLLFPAVGPVHVSQLSSPRNCMPSLHLTWAALLWINARPGSLRGFFLVFIGITALATLATGEHYVLDLIAAVPFTCLVQWLSIVASRRIERLQPALAAESETVT